MAFIHSFHSCFLLPLAIRGIDSVISKQVIWHQLAIYKCSVHRGASEVIFVYFCPSGNCSVNLIFIFH